MSGSQRGRDRGGDRGNRVSLLVRNLPMDVRPDDVRKMFERYGEVRDVYLPKDYYTGKPKGFGFIEFHDNRDAEDALHGLDRTLMGQREITVVMSKESRKTPRDMIKREDTQKYSRNDGGRSRRGSSRSRSPRRGRSRSRSRSRGRSDRERSRRYSRSQSRDRGARDRSRSRSRSGGRRASPEKKRESRSPKRDSRSPKRDSRSPKRDSRSPKRDSRSPKRDSRSPRRDEPEADRRTSGNDVDVDVAEADDQARDQD